MSNFDYYQSLIKPSWAPPAWLFSPVWSILYLIIFITFGFIFYKALTGKIPFIVALPFFLNFIFNFAFTPIQFGLKNNLLATIDILLVLITLCWALFSLWEFNLKLNISTGMAPYTWILYANIPYLLWVLFATILQITITLMNR